MYVLRKKRLIDSVEKYCRHEGHYPARVLADKIYRTHENLAWCKARGIRLLGPRLGRPPKDENIRKEEKELERMDAIDRIQIERDLSWTKGCTGMSLLMTKQPETNECSIGLSTILANALFIDRNLKAV